MRLYDQHGPRYIVHWQASDMHKVNIFIDRALKEKLNVDQIVTQTVVEPGIGCP